MSLPRLSDSTLTALKWLCLPLMFLDHLDWLILDNSLGFHQRVGRIVFPIFGYILAYTLARTDHAARLRLLKRLVFFAMISTPAYIALKGIFPLNILWTFVIVLAVVMLVERGSTFLAGICFLTLPFFVDYQWPGVLVVLGGWAAYRYDQPIVGLVCLAGLVQLQSINGNYYALFALPVMYLATLFVWKLPRAKWAFYSFYPAHLYALALVGLFLSLR